MKLADGPSDHHRVQGQTGFPQISSGDITGQFRSSCDSEVGFQPRFECQLSSPEKEKGSDMRSPSLGFTVSVIHGHTVAVARSNSRRTQAGSTSALASRGRSLFSE